MLTRDYKTSYNVVVEDKESLEFRVSPTFPYPIRFHQRNAGTSSVNGFPLGIPNTTTPPGASVAPLIGAPVDTTMSALFGTSGVTNASADATNFIGARFVSLGYRVFYTGTAAKAEGVIVVDNLSARVTASAKDVQGITQFGFSPTGTLANITIAADTAPYIYVDTTPFEYTTLTSDQVVLRPENGVHGVLKMSKLASDHPFAGWYDTGAFIVQSALPTNNSMDSIYGPSLNVSSNATTKRLGAFFWDDAFMEVNIRLPPGSFRVELTACIEMELAMQSSLIDLARPSPMYDDASLRRDMLLNSLVVPAPFNMPPLDVRMAQMSIGGRQRVRRTRRRPQQPQQQQQQQQKPKQTGKSARRRRNRQRRAA
ncbi:hypothetical protein, partial [Campylobacter coli]|uniref:hypothetical protein n=1 Tax=Campylobacter coli TaxID=195 RepID=UPI00313F38E9